MKIKVSLSSVSCNNAAMNLKAEIPHWDFDKVVKTSAERWKKELSKMTIETKDESIKRIFHTAHYHTMIAPTLFCDVNGEYRGINDMIYTDSLKSNYTTIVAMGYLSSTTSFNDYHTTGHGKTMLSTPCFPFTTNR